VWMRTLIELCFSKCRNKFLFCLYGIEETNILKCGSKYKIHCDECNLGTTLGDCVK